MEKKQGGKRKGQNKQPPITQLWTLSNGEVVATDPPNPMFIKGVYGSQLVVS